MIIYSNPIHQWFWEGGWFWIGAAGLAIGIACILLDKYNAWKRGRKK